MLKNLLEFGYLNYFSYLCIVQKNEQGQASLPINKIRRKELSFSKMANVKKLNLNDVRIQELPNPPYAIGLLNAIQEVCDKISTCGVENGVTLAIKHLRFGLTDGAEDYLKHNLSRVMEGYNRYCYMDYLMPFRIKSMSLECNNLQIETE